MTVHLTLHALQTLPPSNINRDDLGTPKTAVYGGVPRARVSSQAWKRAMRIRFSASGLIPDEDLAVRTRHGIGLLTSALLERRADLDGDAAAEIAEKVFSFVTGVSADTASAHRKAAVRHAPATRETLFLGRRQIDRLAHLAADGADDISAFLKSKANATAVKEAAASKDAVDIALFGRMVATSDDLTVDAAVQVAHAIAVHRTTPETDYFSAVDDFATDKGAGMIGRREFLAPTLYRHAALTGPDLASNLADYAGAMSLQQVTDTFIRVFAESVPSGHITSYAHTTRPAVLIATVSGTPLNHVGAFEVPVETASGGHLPAAAATLAEHITVTNTAYGDPTACSWILTLQPQATKPLHATATPVQSLTELADAAAAELTHRTASIREAV
ncbi:type I-E CRISPR-associated protein Cas7/Cse4/CasC [Streptomyces lydicus]|uniref:type I-E CRISPR-associated protein Cas7/Cse4/CasC n=1 Tax=Streptomyces lydicus TaxID=47763 RepID=UPI0013E8FB0C|nr:type I-E CRISPR-associated protein Cas7/Cse4/CasC [Streptomyces lydicus]MCZ1012132.1 type I-E CRISPR-associated protein Cas7/Cse4/CasC [Streptomyces lydicus]